VAVRDQRAEEEEDERLDGAPEAPFYCRQSRSRPWRRKYSTACGSWVEEETACVPAAAPPHA
jgi:hypothetical protein